MSQPAVPDPPIRTLLPSEILLAFAAGGIPELLGVRETDRVDFKRDPYPLDTDRGRQDLVADVAMFANALGGVLVLGVNTRQHATDRVEFVESMPGYRTGLVHEERYRKVIRDRVAPLVRDLRFHMFRLDSQQEDREFAVLEIAAQREVDKPFIVDRLVDDDGSRLSNAFGWPERSGDSTYWHPKEQIQQLISAGFRLGASLPTPGATEDLAPEEDLTAAWNATNVGDTGPRFAIQLTPIGPRGRFREFFGSDRESLRQWRPQRSVGFGFDLTWHQPAPVGNRIIATDSYGSLVLDREGILTLVYGLVGSVFLWGSPPVDTVLQINPFVLTEWVGEAVRLAYEFLSPRLEPESWQIRFIATDLGPEPRVAIRRPELGFMAPWLATTDADDFTIEGIGTDWEAVAFDVLAEIYGRLFSLTGRDVYGARSEQRRIDLPDIDNFGRG